MSPDRPIELDRWVAPEDAYLSLSKGKEAAFWLDSSRVEHGLASKSFVGFVGADQGSVIRYRSVARQITLQEGRAERVSRESLFSYLERELKPRGAPDEWRDEFRGLVGYIGYELKGECGAQAPYRSSLSDAAFIRPGQWVTFDHQERRAFATAGVIDGHTPVASEIPHAADGPITFRLAQSREQYLANVERCQRYIREGESYELCLTNQIHVEAPSLDPLNIYRHLRRLNPAPYSAFLNFGDFAVLSSSPERFLRIGADGSVETKPIKGTRPRGRTPDEDERLREELRGSIKDRAENLMITDLMRNDLGRVCETGSVHVPKLMDVETYATVHQLVSTVRGQLRADRTALDCIHAAFPGGSMTGAPKLRAMSLLDELERAPRGIYSGAIGYLGDGGATDLSIAIRTIICSGGRLSIGMGGAIVSLSDPVAEFEETLTKARAQIAAVVAAQRGSPAPEVVEDILQNLRESGTATLSA